MRDFARAYFLPFAWRKRIKTYWQITGLSGDAGHKVASRYMQNQKGLRDLTQPFKLTRKNLSSGQGTTASSQMVQMVPTIAPP
jgi:hypothetical protein